MFVFLFRGVAYFTSGTYVNGQQFWYDVEVMDPASYFTYWAIGHLPYENNRYSRIAYVRAGSGM